MAGLPYLKVAVDADPAHEQYALSYAEALFVSGQAAEAVSVLQTAMQRGINTAAVQTLRQRAEAAVAGETAKAEAPTPPEMNQLVAACSTQGAMPNRRPGRACWLRSSPIPG